MQYRCLLPTPAGRICQHTLYASLMSTSQTSSSCLTHTHAYTHSHMQHLVGRHGVVWLLIAPHECGWHVTTRTTCSTHRQVTDGAGTALCERCIAVQHHLHPLCCQLSRRLLISICVVPPQHLNSCLLKLQGAWPGWRTLPQPELPREQCLLAAPQSVQALNGQWCSWPPIAEVECCSYQRQQCSRPGLQLDCQSWVLHTNMLKVHIQLVLVCAQLVPAEP
jgi:hypothetical protein